jgi:hypothetical protein
MAPLGRQGEKGPIRHSGARAERASAIYCRLEIIVAFGINGFGAVQTYPVPSLFQALSLGNAPPLPPNPPYGTPNPNLVSVNFTGKPPPAVPVNLTLAAAPVQEAIQKISAQTILSYSHPPLQATANSTTAVSATNPSIADQQQGASPDGIPARIDLPTAAVSFLVTAASSSLTSGAEALQQTIAKLQQGQEQALADDANAQNNAPSTGGSTNPSQGGSSQPAPAGEAPPAPAAPAGGSGGGSKVTTPAPASPGIVGKIVAGIQSLAISAIYSSPVFSFSA